MDMLCYLIKSESVVSIGPLCSYAPSLILRSYARMLLSFLARVSDGKGVTRQQMDQYVCTLHLRRYRHLLGRNPRREQQSGFVEEKCLQPIDVLSSVSCWVCMTLLRSSR
jgi:hypothetical protein